MSYDSKKVTILTQWNFCEGYTLLMYFVLIAIFEEVSVLFFILHLFYPDYSSLTQLHTLQNIDLLFLLSWSNQFLQTANHLIWFVWVNDIITFTMQLVDGFLSSSFLIFLIMNTNIYPIILGYNHNGKKRLFWHTWAKYIYLSESLIYWKLFLKILEMEEGSFGKKIRSQK